MRIFSEFRAAVTFLWYFLLVEAKESTIDQKVIIFEVPIISLRWGTLRENKNNFLVSPLGKSLKDSIFSPTPFVDRYFSEWAQIRN